MRAPPWTLGLVATAVGAVLLLLSAWVFVAHHQREHGDLGTGNDDE